MKKTKRPSRKLTKLAMALKKSVLTKTQSSLKCAWCGKPATGFLAQHPHCGRVHALTGTGGDVLLMKYNRLRVAAWKVVNANEAMYVSGEVDVVARACEKLKAVLRKL